MLRHLLSPVGIGRLDLRNRVAMAPMGLDLVEPDGHIREPTIRYYAERARGGVGLIVTENTAAAHPWGANSAHEIAVSGEDHLPGLTRLAEAVHEHGAKIAIQLAHHGKVGRLDTQQGRSLLMPSPPRSEPAMPSGPLDLTRAEMKLMARAAGNKRPSFREATGADLVALVAAFAEAAERARRAGFDGVEIHGAHGYVFSAFLSPAWNFRQDEWGGTVENRSRLLCETVRACKERAGPDFPIWCRIDANEFGIKNGIRPEDAVRTSELLEEAGADAIHVSAYANPFGAGFTDGPIPHQEGGFVEFAKRIKERIRIPVIVAGRISPDLGDRIVRDGHADIVAMGRQLLADPETVAKLAAGRARDVRPCVYCYVCAAQPFFDERVRCSVNPVAAAEVEFAEALRTKSPSPKKVVVIGGGPAGMEAASVAATRGHDVTLLERQSALGGTLRFAALSYEPNDDLLRFMTNRVQSLPIEVRLGTDATVESVREHTPDVLIAALGASRQKCSIPGADQSHVWDGDDLRAVLSGESAQGAFDRVSGLTRLALAAGRIARITTNPSRLRQASRFYMPVGRNVAIIGGGLVGIELAEFLSQRARRVTVLEEGPVLAPEMAHPRRWRVLFELREAGVSLHSDCRVLEIGSSSVSFEMEADDREPEPPKMAPADTVIVATGLRPNVEGVWALSTAAPEVRVVGDASGVGYIEGAIHEGFRAAIDL